ncbi:glycosyltransferase family 2 protein [Chitinophaga tropicalis]|uniref:Glycosyltransferase n=1 Tax=Chitinophaga tropicalis TaxID=2683588 RepID=A0A7K1U4R3_9BACT|nr:glycosyltransferase family 2 protein [Chitinophaga tropicalis]MVT09348.1 glycosyltransferase [Chitinophaga tropicalis]
MNYKVNAVKLDFNPVFSILIPTWNNLDYLKCVVNSIRKNSIYRHQILVHINQGNDGTEDWVLSQKDIGYTKSTENSGVCFGFNAISHLAISARLVLIDDDLYLCPEWDEHLLSEIEKMPDEKWCISSTMIEPRKGNNPCVIQNQDFGRHPAEFEEERFLQQYKRFEKKDWNGSQWYPLVLPTFVFRAIGGLSVEFSPGMHSDPDFMIKLWRYGIRYYKGVSRSRAYHFGSISTAKVKKNDGRSTFILKWGMSSNTFFNNYIKIGTDFNGYVKDPEETKFLQFKKLIDRWKVKFKTRPVPISKTHH